MIALPLLHGASLHFRLFTDSNERSSPGNRLLCDAAVAHGASDHLKMEE